MVDVDFPNTTESYKLYSQVCDLPEYFLLKSHILFPFLLNFALWQRVVASDIKECVCRAPDTPYDGLLFFLSLIRLSDLRRLVAMSIAVLNA